jgi:hypothetical protein
MELGIIRRRRLFSRAILAAATACACWLASACSFAREAEVSEEFLEVQESLSTEETMFPEGRSILDEEVLPPADESLDDRAGSLIDPQGEIGSLDESGGGGDFATGEHEHLRPFDYMRHWGFHHSSTEGRFMEKSVPLNFSSWLNRPVPSRLVRRPACSATVPIRRPTSSRQTPSSAACGSAGTSTTTGAPSGASAGSDPEIFYEGSSDRQPGQYWVSDVNLIYYPWGDTRVRPFFVTGIGISEIGSLHNDGGPLEANLLGTPFGHGHPVPADAVARLAGGDHGQPCLGKRRVEHYPQRFIHRGNEHPLRRAEALLLAVANVAALLVELPDQPLAPPGGSVTQDGVDRHGDRPPPAEPGATCS